MVYNTYDALMLEIVTIFVIKEGKKSLLSSFLECHWKIFLLE